MKKFILTQDEYEDLCGVISIAINNAGTHGLREEIKTLYERIEEIAAECNDNEFRAGQVDIIKQLKGILEIE